MTENELIQEARKDWPDVLIHTVLQACEEYYMNGCYDNIGGDVDSPTGHFYRIERWVVVTDSQGFHFLHTFDNESQAIATFESLDKEYSEWGEE